MVFVMTVKKSDLETKSHITARPLYTPADLEAWDYDRQVSYPGEYPFTRGVQATMHRGRLWTMRQYAGMGDAEESNKRYKYLRRLRSADANWSGLRPPAGRGRGRKSRRRHRFHRRYATPLRRHRTDQ